MDIRQRRRKLIAQTEIEGQALQNPPVILDEPVKVSLAHIHGRDSGLPLREHRKSQQEAGQGIAGTIVGGGLCSEARSELEETAVLEESQHVPAEPSHVAAELQGMRAMNPGETVTPLKDRIPIARRRGQERIAERL